MSKNPKLIDKWLSALPRAARGAVSAVIAAADASGTPLYLVGGPVRDLVLGRPSLDIDLVAEGDAIDLAQRSGRYLEARVKAHPTFGTATLTVPAAVGAGFKPARPERPEGATTPRPARPEVSKDEAAAQPTVTIDLTTARRETYPRTGALPEVESPATIEEDLLRRDFTVNAMALRLNGPDRGDLLDPTNGRADLEARRIRILHDRSFQDDPTRILRAVRYGIRLSPSHLNTDDLTRKCLRRDLPLLKIISTARLRSELARIGLEQQSRGYMVTVLNDTGILKTIHPSLVFTTRSQLAMDRLAEWSAPQASFWPALAWAVDAGTAHAVTSALGLRKTEAAAVEVLPELRRVVQTLAVTSVHRYRLVRTMEPFPVAAVWAVAAFARGNRVGRQKSQSLIEDRLLEYLREARFVRPILRGDDIIALGVPEGPAVGQVLARLRAAKLDGEVKTRRQEEALVRRMVKSEG